MVDITNNCCKCTDPQYTIELNAQGPQGIQGEQGQDGFSPEISLYNVSDSNVQLKILNKDSEIITPNLKAQNDVIFAPWTGTANPSTGGINLTASLVRPTVQEGDTFEWNIDYGINQIAYVNLTGIEGNVSVLRNATPVYTTLIYQNGVLIGVNTDYGLNSLNLNATNPIVISHNTKSYVSTISLNIDNTYLDTTSDGKLTLNEDFILDYPTKSGTNVFSGRNTFNGDVYLKNVYGGTNNVLNMTAGTLTLQTSISTRNIFATNLNVSNEVEAATYSLVDKSNILLYNNEELRLELGDTATYLAFKAATNSNLVVYRGSTSNVPSQILDTYNMMNYLPTASTTSKGMVQVDGTTITINENGVISSVGGGSLPDNVLTSDNISQDTYIQSLVARIAALEALIDGGNATND